MLEVSDLTHTYTDIGSETTTLTESLTLYSVNFISYSSNLSNYPI